MAEASQGRGFSHREAGELIESATRLQQERDRARARIDEGLTYDQLVEIATELGVGEEDLLQAIAHRSKEPEPTPWYDRLTRGLGQRAIAYLGLVGGFTVIDVAEGGGIDWAYYPAAGFLLLFSIRRFLRP